VWALLIPLIVILILRPHSQRTKWLVAYVIIAFILNFLAIFIVEYYYLTPAWMKAKGNNIFYNLHALVMVICFSCYLMAARKYKYIVILKSLFIIYLAFVALNFGLWESRNLLSTRHFTAGSIILLIFCLCFFFSSILEESEINWLKEPSFLIGVAVFLYQAITFFIFLFIYPMYNETYNKDLSFAMLMMRVYQVVFVVFCLLIAFAIHINKKQEAMTNAQSTS
jgi:hypothetical protein